VPFSDSLVILVVTIVTVWTDLATAVVVGVIISALVYSWNASTRMRATTDIEPTHKDVKIYRLFGPLFFGSVESFSELFDPENDPETVIIDFLESRVVDHSGLQAIDALAERYQKAGTGLKLRHLSKDCQALLNRAGQLVEPDSSDPSYGVAVDYAIRHGQLNTGH
jgi:SulP family sulfate permease